MATMSLNLSRQGCSLGDVTAAVGRACLGTPTAEARPPVAAANGGGAATAAVGSGRHRRLADLAQHTDGGWQTVAPVGVAGLVLGNRSLRLELTTRVGPDRSTLLRRGPGK